MELFDGYHLFLLLLFVLLLLVDAVTTFTRSALRSVNLQRFEEEHDHEAYDDIIALRQEHSVASYAVSVIQVVTFSSALIICTQEALIFGGSPGLVGGAIVVAASILVLRAVAASLGERYAESLADVGLSFLRSFVFLTFPVSFALERLANGIGGPQTEEEAREEMEDEITAIMDEAVQEGTLDADEYRILTNIMQFSEVTVKDVMTPRNVVFSLSTDRKVSDILDRGELQTYSRFPVCTDQSLDEVVGYCLTRDILYAALQGQGDVTLDRLMRDVTFIPENVRLDKVLEEFLTRRQHMFLVVDEYGGVEGLITMEDVVETILGAEIVDEADRVVDMRQLASLRRDQRIAGSVQPSEAAASDRSVMDIGDATDDDDAREREQSLS
ncbi:MAG: CBS domain-containing protein [Candidatus Kapaibacterium sp.]